MLETLDFTIRIGSTPTFLYFDLYLHSAYAAHYVYFSIHTLGVIKIKQKLYCDRGPLAASCFHLIGCPITMFLCQID